MSKKGANKLADAVYDALTPEASMRIAELALSGSAARAARLR